MGTTDRGISYPDPSGVPSRSALQSLAETADAAIDGLAAVLPYRSAAGKVTVTLAAATSGNTTITFPVGRFSVPPLVFVTLSSAAAGTQTMIARAINVTAADAAAYAYTGDSVAVSASVDVSWFAVQMTEVAAAG